MEKGGWVYIMTNKPNGTLYVGVTNDLSRRVFEHREGAIGGFTKRYGLKRLVYFERHEDIGRAIQRESRDLTCFQVVSRLPRVISNRRALKSEPSCCLTLSSARAASLRQV